MVGLRGLAMKRNERDPDRRGRRAPNPWAKAVGLVLTATLYLNFNKFYYFKSTLKGVKEFYFLSYQN